MSRSRVTVRFVGVGILVAVTALVGTGFSGATHTVKKTTIHSVGWFNSFEDARREAMAKQRPILLLSMFGKLDEAMPCANARTLRATLFKDPEFRKFATDEVVPAWEMVRAVPHVYIDLGDGKQLVRTVRGNAVMYLCKPDGKVIDAYPGIYTTADFLAMAHESLAKMATSDTAAAIAYHRERGFIPILSMTTVTKAIVESPTLEMIGARPTLGVVTRVTDPNADRAKFLLGASKLSDLSLTPMKPAAAVKIVTGRKLGEESSEALQQEVLMTDSRNNIMRLRPVVHLYFASLKELPTPKEARDAVLETILKIPYKDPYFGLKDVLMPGTPE